MSIKGIGSKDNLKDWADYAKGNSYKPDRAAVKHSLGTEGCKDDIEQGLPPLPKQKDSEGQGWVKMDRVTADNTYTGKGGSKRG